MFHKHILLLPELCTEEDISVPMPEPGPVREDPPPEDKKDASVEEENNEEEEEEEEEDSTQGDKADDDEYNPDDFPDLPDIDDKGAWDDLKPSKREEL